MELGEHYEQTLKNLAETLVTARRFGKHATQLAFEEFDTIVVEPNND